MISTNRITKGLFLAVDPAYQPEGTVVVNHNGHFLSYDQGSYKWISAKGNQHIAITIDLLEENYIALGLKILKMVSWGNDILLFAINNTSNGIIAKITLSDDLTMGVYTELVNNTNLNFNEQYPIKQAYIVYENENTIRLYWNDTLNPPRCLNLSNIPNPLRIDLLSFSPPNTTGTIIYQSEIAGSLYNTNYYYTYRLVAFDGTATDFSMLSNAVSVGKVSEIALSGYHGYQAYQGDNFTVKSNVGVRLSVVGIDTDYDIIEVYAFKANALNAVESGVLIAKLDVTGYNMLIDHTGNENLGGISMDTVNIKSRVITQCNLMEITNNRMILADYAEREDIPEIPGGKILKNKMTGVTIQHDFYEMPIDYVGMPGLWQHSHGLETKPLSGIKANSTIQYKNQWYYDSGSATWFFGDGISAKQADQQPYIRIRKYLRYSGGNVYDNHTLYNSFLDYKSKKVSSLIKGYRGLETYRFGIVFIDNNGKDLPVRWIGDHQFPARTGVNKLLVEYNTKFNARVIHAVISGIDLAELTTVVGGVVTACSVSGFKIVRAPLDKQRISQGVLFPTVTESAGDGSARSLLPYPRVKNSLDVGGGGRIKKLYVYNSPEHLFDYQGADIQAGDTFEAYEYLQGIMSDREYTGRVHVNWNNIYQKYYTDLANPPANYKALGTENIIVNSYSWPFNKDGHSDVYVGELNRTVKNESRDASNYDGYGCASTLVVLTNEEASDDDHFSSFKHYSLFVVNQVRKKTNLYGGTSDAALSATTYIETGHYQAITTSILQDLKTRNGDLVFGGINIFGGDTYISIFDLQRIIKQQLTSDEEWFSHAMLMPIESEMNLALRGGVHVSKDRSYDHSRNTTGIGLRGAYITLEDYNYNDAYSTQYTGKYLDPLPYNFQVVARNEHSVIWTGIKFLGETIDNYRLFPVNNIRTLETRFGKIKYIYGVFEKLVYLQEKGYGYMPLNERVMINNNQNLPVQLGIGGVFDRDDTIDRWIGCQHYYSVIQTPNGLVWFDFDNRAFIYLSNNLKADNKTIVAGLEPFFNSLSDRLKDNDNPYYNYGIFSHYDIQRKEVMMTFIQQPPSGKKTIIFNEKSGTFTGTTDLWPTQSLIHKGKTLLGTRTKVHPYISNIGVNRTFFDTAYLGKIRFIINDQYDIYKIFDNFKVLGNTEFFDKIRFKGQSFTETEEIVLTNGVITSPHFEFRNNEWLGSFPIDENGQRLRGHYLEIEFEINASNTRDVSLISLLTSYRKSY